MCTKMDWGAPTFTLCSPVEVLDCTYPHDDGTAQLPSALCRLSGGASLRREHGRKQWPWVMQLALWRVSGLVSRMASVMAPPGTHVVYGV